MNVVKLYYSGGTYGNWELLPEKLLIVENISSYLATKNALTVNDVQYQKNKLELFIKLDLPQGYSQPNTSLSFKYMSIQNDNEKVHYYFIKNLIWKSKSCVEIEAVLDVLNTFQEGTDYDFKRNTRIIREHKSRFKRRNYVIRIQFDNIVSKSDNQIVVGDEVTLADNDTPLDPLYTGKVVEVSYGTPNYVHVMITDVNVDHIIQWLYDLDEILIESSSGEWVVGEEIAPAFVSNEWFRSVDYIPEGINPVLQHKSETTYPVEDESPLDCDWYLLYRNQNEPDEAHQFVNPIDCYLIPGDALSVKVSAITAGKMNANSLESGKYYMIRIIGSGTPDVFTLDDGTNIGATSLGTHAVYIVVYKNANDRIVVSMCEGDIANGSQNVWPLGSYETGTLTLNHLPQSYKKVSALPTGHTYNAWEAVYSAGTSGSWSNGAVNLTTDTIEQIDRTDSKNVKLIKLPYCPYDFTITGGKVDISNDSNWEYASCQEGGTCYCLKLLTNAKLERHLEGYPTLTVLKFEPGDFPTPSLTDTRIVSSAWFDPKLLMSEFYSEVYFYDSFQFNIEFENADLDRLISSWYDFDSFAITFTMTKTINSKFMFTFTDYIQRLSKSNISQVLPVARNNEEVLYNVPYINWIRSGYNYEIKAKNLQIASSGIGLALGAGTTIASLALPSAPLKIAGIVGSLASMANAAKGTLVSALSAENSIKAKIEEKKRQTNSVAGSDDVDLMTEYCGNRLRNVIYEPNPVIKNTLDELFFYAGYRSDRMGLPNHINRVNFDYLECDASLENIRSIPSDCLSELIKCFKTGVTYMHRNPMIGWDFEQTHENWERFIFD